MMRAVIVLITLFIQVISIVLGDGVPPQLVQLQRQQFFLPAKQGLPAALPGLPPLPTCPPAEPPSDGQSPPIIPGDPDPAPPRTDQCPCCKPPTGALALLLDIVANLMNLPKGSLSKLPLCCTKNVNIPPQLLALTAPLSSVRVPPKLQLTPAQIEAFIRLLRTPQALAQTIKPSTNPPFFPFQNFNLLPQDPNLPSLEDCPIQNPYSPPQNLNFPQQNLNFSPQNPNFPPQIPNFTTQFQSQPSGNQPLPVCPPPPQCITHQIEPNVRPVVDECIRSVPVYQNTIRHEEEQTIRKVPVVERTLTNQEEHVVRHVPVVRRFTRPVIETRTRHIPVTRKRIRTVVEPYTTHVPILEKFTRPVEEMFITSVPVVEKRSRPIYTHTVRQVPVTERRIRPVVQSQITQVPVKQRVVKHFIEHRARPCLVPAEHFGHPVPPPPCNVPFPPTFLNVPGTPSYPCHR